MEKLCHELARRISSDVRARPATIIAVSRGGLVPATILSYALGMEDVETIHPLISRERAEEEMKFLRGFYPERFNVLVVDDIIKTGASLAAVLKAPHFEGIRTAALHVLSSLREDLRPDYFIEVTETEILYPWHQAAAVGKGGAGGAR